MYKGAKRDMRIERKEIDYASPKPDGKNRIIRHLKKENSIQTVLN